MTLNAKIPSGPIEDKWRNYCATVRLVSPANKQRLDIIVVGTGLAGASAAATLAELGYNVYVFTYHDSARRAHSIAAQGGINAAKNYRNDGDAILRLFYDTIKGGDFRAREANVWRLAEISTKIIDHCVAQGVPFNREYSGYLDNRSFGGVQVERTFYCQGQTGQQLLLGAYQALMRQVRTGKVKYYPRFEMLDVVVIDGKARGIIARNLLTGEIKSFSAHAIVLATGGYGNIYYLSTNAVNSNATAIWRAHKKGAFFANPCFTQIHPTCIPRSGEYQSKLILMSESLRNDGRVWVPKNPNDNRNPNDIPEEDRDYFLERIYPSYGNLVPRDVGSRAIMRMCKAGYGVGPYKQAVYLDFRDAIRRLGEQKIQEKYGNLFEMYETITGVSPWKNPMMIYPAVHYCMGGLWVDYELSTTIPGLYAVGECNFSDHGANRLGASALMQGLGDGYFILPYTIGNYLADFIREPKVSTDHPEFKRCEKEVKDKLLHLLSINGKRAPRFFHMELGKILWENCGMSRNKKGLEEALSAIRGLRDEFYRDVKMTGNENEFNQTLEYANRISDYLELAELMVIDALHREESCGCHFREEYATPDEEPLRNDEKYAYVAAWEWTGNPSKPNLHKENLTFEKVKLTVRSYK